MSTTTLNQENIIKKVYDPGTETLKVNAIATIAPGILEITISDTDDSIKVGDGTGNYIQPNPDGSLNVVVTSASSGTVKNIFNEVSNVANGVTTTIINYTAIVDTKLLSCDFSGTNIASYYLYINSNLNAKKYTYFASLNEKFDFKNGLSLNPGDVITIEVLHDRPDLGMFNANMLIED